MDRRFSVKIGAKEYVVELGTDDDGASRVVVDGVQVDVDLSLVEPGAWLLRKHGEQTLARVDAMGAGKVGVSIKRGGADVVFVEAQVAEARSAAVAALVKATRASAASGPLTVKSPMPGRIVKVLVKPGARVAAGAPVVVVEAMKMENELRAPRAGVVGSVDLRAVEGASVEAGQDLVTLTPDAATRDVTAG
ncbi:MAG TPA: biotin/lipoyl-containing protein [Polyangia bacterium]|nr:biotin/lipoyl-containing protein [Polyangia bacterium]